MLVLFVLILVLEAIDCAADYKKDHYERKTLKNQYWTLKSRGKVDANYAVVDTCG